MGLLEETAGVILGGIVLIDIFQQILYARANKTLLSTPLANLVWRSMVKVSEPMGYSLRESFLTFSGPVILVLILTSWALLLSLALDTVSLIETALDEKEYGWLRHSAAVEELWNASMLELKTLIGNFIPDADVHAPPEPERRAIWQRRYEMAVEYIGQSGIETRKDGAQDYIALWSQWDRYITLLAPKFAFDMDVIDPTLAKIKKQLPGFAHGY